jgi:hypothetical protein
MSRYRGDSLASVFPFILGVGVGAAIVILLGSKKIDQLHDDINEAFHDGLDQVRSKGKDLRRQAQKTFNAAQEKVQEAIDAGTDAFNEARRS